MRNLQLKQILYIVFILFLGYSFVGSMRLFLKAKANLSDAQIVLQDESGKNQKLQDKLISEEKGIYIERVARDTLGLSRPDEIVFVLPPENELKEFSPRKALKESADSSEASVPHWQEWVKLFI